MALLNGEIVILQKENVSDYFEQTKPSSNELTGYRDGTLDVLHLIGDITHDSSIHTVDDIRHALLNLRKNRLELISLIDKTENVVINTKNTL